MCQINALLKLTADDMQHVENKMRSGISERYADLQAVVDYLMSAGGKRLRPMLTLAMAKLSGYRADGHIKHKKY